MALKKIAEYQQGQRRAVLYRDSEWREYRVKFYISEAYQKDSDYHDVDKRSADDTASTWVKAGANIGANAAYPAICP